MFGDVFGGVFEGWKLNPTLSLAFKSIMCIEGNQKFAKNVRVAIKLIR